MIKVSDYHVTHLKSLVTDMCYVHDIVGKKLILQLTDCSQGSNVKCMFTGY
jgi:hypothetical protein